MWLPCGTQYAVTIDLQEVLEVLESEVRITGVRFNKIITSKTLKFRGCLAKGKNSVEGVVNYSNRIHNRALA